MTKNDDDTALIRGSDLPLALALLTRLPVPLPGGGHAASRTARAAWAYPLVGLAPGGLAALTGLLAITLGLGPPIAAMIALITMIFATGALHEDGLADCADGFWGGWTPERRLEIMRDSRIGTYGVLALIVSLGLRWAALSALFGTGQAAAALLTAAVLSRAAMPALMSALPHARRDGLSHSVGRVPRRTAGLAAFLGFAVSVVIFGPAGVALSVLAALTALGVGALTRSRIGGQSGDVLGATQQLVEIAVLVAVLI
ncbi:MAG: adenosylcobinamide-GDP ribazoletransferase [Pseudomonadota bacterium]